MAGIIPYKLPAGQSPEKLPTFGSEGGYADALTGIDTTPAREVSAAGQKVGDRVDFNGEWYQVHSINENGTVNLVEMPLDEDSGAPAHLRLANTFARDAEDVAYGLGQTQGKGNVRIRTKPAGLISRKLAELTDGVLGSETENVVDLYDPVAKKAVQFDPSRLDIGDVTTDAIGEGPGLLTQGGLMGPAAKVTGASGILARAGLSGAGAGLGGMAKTGLGYLAGTIDPARSEEHDAMAGLEGIGAAALTPVAEGLANIGIKGLQKAAGTRPAQKAAGILRPAKETAQDAWLAASGSDPSGFGLPADYVRSVGRRNLAERFGMSKVEPGSILDDVAPKLKPVKLIQEPPRRSLQDTPNVRATEAHPIVDETTGEATVLDDLADEHAQQGARRYALPDDEQVALDVEIAQKQTAIPEQTLGRLTTERGDAVMAAIAHPDQHALRTQILEEAQQALDIMQRQAGDAYAAVVDPLMTGTRGFTKPTKEAIRTNIAGMLREVANLRTSKTGQQLGQASLPPAQLAVIQGLVDKVKTLATLQDGKAFITQARALPRDQIYGQGQKIIDGITKAVEQGILQELTLIDPTGREAAAYQAAQRAYAAARSRIAPLRASVETAPSRTGMGEPYGYKFVRNLTAANRAGNREAIGYLAARFPEYAEAMDNLIAAGDAAAIERASASPTGVSRQVQGLIGAASSPLKAASMVVDSTPLRVVTNLWTKYARERGLPVAAGRGSSVVAEKLTRAAEGLGARFSGKRAIEENARIAREAMKARGQNVRGQSMPTDQGIEPDINPGVLVANASAAVYSKSKTAPIAIRKLSKDASKGDMKAWAELQQIAIDMVDDRLKHVEGITYDIIPTAGTWESGAEPSVSVRIELIDANKEAEVVDLLQSMGAALDQQQVHILKGVEGNKRVGLTNPDGSFYTRVIEFTTAKPLTLQQAQRIIKSAKLGGASYHDGKITIYYAGDPADEKAVHEFRSASSRLYQLARNGNGVIRRGSARLWVYGTGRGAIPYSYTDGTLHPATGAEGIATARRTFMGERPAAQQVKVTPEQASKQAEIAEDFEKLPDDDMKNPIVMEAYRRLASKIKEQYLQMPIKVRVGTVATPKVPGQKLKGNARFTLDYSEPYKTSNEMRTDVKAKNQIKIFGTDAKTFGPEGMDFSGHPLLKMSGIKDIQGYELTYNDLLRAVHDYIAHGASPTSFGPAGEEAAWKNHIMTIDDPMARWALTTETRGQNSWVNFNKNVAPDSPLSARPFARQKAALLPLEWSLVNDPKIDAPVLELIKKLGPAASRGSLPADAVTNARPTQLQKPTGTGGYQRELQRFKARFKLPITETHKPITDASGKQLRAYYDMDNHVAVVYVGDNPDAATVRRALIHEVIGHHGILKVLGADYGYRMAQVKAKYPALFAQLRAELGLEDSREGNLIVAEEIIARAAEKRYDELPKGIRKTWNQLRLGFKDMYNKRTGHDLTDDDMDALFSQSENAAEGKSVRAPVGATIGIVKGAQENGRNR